MTKITTDFVGSETIAVTKQRLTDILAYWGASTAAYTTWGQARTAMNALLTSTTAGTIGATELAGSFLPKINFLNDPDDMVLDALFGAGEQGVWLDPSDLTTMFQDAAGTTPVTAPGQPVGLRLDKSKGLVLGAELVTNGDFSGGTTGWTAGFGTTTSTLTISGGGAGLLTVASPDTTPRYGQAITGLTVGKFYRIDCDTFSSSGAGDKYFGWTSLSVFAGGESWLSLHTTPRYYQATATTMYVWFGFNGSSAGATITIDNISVRELPGNHATQSVLGSRPMYGIEPKGGRRNLLTFSEQFDNAAWNVGNTASKLPNTEIAPDGTLTADTITYGTGTSQWFGYDTPLTLTAGQPYTFSVWIKRKSGTGQIQLNIDPYSLSWNNVAITTSWQRFSITQTPTSTGAPPVICGLLFVASAADEIYLWGAQLELGSTATNYQRVTTDFDVTEAGVNSCHYCQYDGSDDGMVTNSIDFTATDKMSAFAGVRKLSDAVAVIIESSPDVDASNPGAFILYTAPNIYGGRTRGSILPPLPAASPANYAAPKTNVVAVIGDIPADTVNLRVNGAQVAQTTTDQGTGNFGNYKLNIGRRGNDQPTPTLPFNGRDYGILITGKLANATAIATTEMWLANKTAGVNL